MPQLIPHWKASWRMMSQQAFAAIVVVQAMEGPITRAVADIIKALPPEIQAMSFSQHIVGWLTSFLAILGIVLRLVSQPKVQAAEIQAIRESGLADLGPPETRVFR